MRNPRKSIAFDIHERERETEREREKERETERERQSCDKFPQVSCNPPALTILTFVLK